MDKKRLDKIIVKDESLLKKEDLLKTYPEKNRFLLDLPITKAFFKKHPRLEKIMQSFNEIEKYCLYTLIAIGQAETIFHGYDQHQHLTSYTKKIADNLIDVETFYYEIGGIIGYHKKVLELIEESEWEDLKSDVKIEIENPSFVDFTQNEERKELLAKEGIKNLPQTGWIFPMGGAGDRLGLLDPDSKTPLPTAFLPFLGKPLLQRLIEDVQSLENLYYSTYNKSILTPIAIMTSRAKNNHQKILTFLEEKNYFFRPKESIILFEQVSVPMVTEEGKWALKEPLKIALRPGGHGVLWKLMQDRKIFEWFEKKGCEKALIRQINNPIANTDATLLSLLGYGCKEKKAMGFASCPRLMHSAEGMLVKKRIQNNETHFSISNIEYTDFAKWKLEDAPLDDKCRYSRYPSNTNILFIDLKEIQKAIKKDPFPGMIINLKNPTKSHSGKELLAGRLELMMQNISDSLTFKQENNDKKKRSLDKKIDPFIPTFLTYNSRRKTISATKRQFDLKKPILETPMGAYYDMFLNAYELLHEHSHIDLPPKTSIEEFVKKPPFFFFYHPALGPLFSTISEKMKGGKIYENGFADLEISDLLWENVSLNGSLQIIASSPLGQNDQNSLYNKKRGRVVLKNLRIENEGIDIKANNLFFEKRVHHKESLFISLEGNSLFIAEDIMIKGNHFIEVRDGERVTATQKEGKLFLERSIL